MLMTIQLVLEVLDVPSQLLVLLILVRDIAFECSYFPIGSGHILLSALKCLNLHLELYDLYLRSLKIGLSVVLLLNDLIFSLSLCLSHSLNEREEPERFVFSHTLLC